MSPYIVEALSTILATDLHLTFQLLYYDPVITHYCTISNTGGFGLRSWVSGIWSLVVSLWSLVLGLGSWVLAAGEFINSRVCGAFAETVLCQCRAARVFYRGYPVGETLVLIQLSNR